MDNYLVKLVRARTTTGRNILSKVLETIGNSLSLAVAILTLVILAIILDSSNT